jgi:Putative lumazine-binding
MRMLHISILWSFLGLAQGPSMNDFETPVRHYFAARNTGNPEELQAALHPSMMMFWVSDDGTLASLSSSRWIGRMKTNVGKKATPDASQKIEFTDVENEGGVIKTAIDNSSGGFRDYLTVLKSHGQWWVIGKIFHHFESQKIRVRSKTDQEADRAAVEAVIKSKMKAMDTNDGALLAACYHPRAMTFGVERGELVATSIAEWTARFEADRTAKVEIGKVTRNILRIDIETDAAFAKFEHVFTNGTRVVDYASLAKLKDGWKIVGLHPGFACRLHSFEPAKPDSALVYLQK